jgi:hypothetical protein
MADRLDAEPGTDETILPIVSLVDYFANRRGLTVLRGPSEYSRREPLLVNPDQALPHIVRRYRRSLVGRTPAEGVALFEDATITAVGRIVVAEGSLLAESAERPSEVEPVPCVRAKTLESGVLVAKTGSANYGHFLVEMLPRILLNQQALPRSVPILLDYRSEPFAPAILEYAGVDASRIRWLDADPLRVARLWWPTRNTFHPLNNSPHTIAYLQSLGAHARGDAKAGTRTRRRLFVGRRDARTRRLRNEDDVYSWLEPLGFEHVTAGRLSFSQQVETFAHAEIVVGVAGAALANIVFMPPGGRIILLSPDGMPALWFWDVASQAGHDSIFCWGPSSPGTPQSVVTGRGRGPWVKHADFTISRDQLEAALAVRAAGSGGPG